MQTRLLANIAVGLALLVTVAGCQRRVVVNGRTTTSTSVGAAKGLPPGQAKKIYGHQSAKAFAPGQQKKQNSTVIIVNGNDNGKHNKKKSGKKK